MTQRYAFTAPDGRVAIYFSCEPTEELQEENLKRLMNEKYGEELPFLKISAEDLPEALQDQFRDSWIISDGKIICDESKCKSIRAKNLKDSVMERESRDVESVSQRLRNKAYDAQIRGNSAEAVRLLDMVDELDSFDFDKDPDMPSDIKQMETYVPQIIVDAKAELS